MQSPRGTPLTKVVREFFELGGYRAFPDVVTLEVHVHTIRNIDFQAATVDVKVDLFIRWYDKFFDQARYFDWAGGQVSTPRQPLSARVKPLSSPCTNWSGGPVAQYD